MGSIAVETTYEEFEGLVHHIAIEMWEHYGGDRDEFVSTANWSYHQAYLDWQPARATFRQWVDRYVRYQLLELIRTNARRWKILQRVHDYNLEKVIEPTFDVEQFTDAMSDDAQAVVEIALGGVGSKTELRNYLRTEHEWSLARIARTFNEIRDAL